jgi:O-antigen ligase
MLDMQVGKKASDLFNVITLSALFLIHIFSYEREKNNYIEYDQHFVNFIGSLLITGILIKIFISPPTYIQLTSLCTVFLSFLFYTVLQSLFNNLIEKRFVYTLFLLTGAYFVWRSYLPDLNFKRLIATSFLACISITLSFQFFEVNIFHSKIFPDGASEMNSGVNAIFWASVLPFMVAIVFYFNQGDQFSYQLFKTVAFVACLFIFYLIVISNSRAAWVSGFVSIILLSNQQYKLLNKVSRTLHFRGAKLLFGILLICIVCWIATILYQYKLASSNGRLLIYEVCLNIINYRPVIGVGIDRFGAHYNFFQAKYFMTHSVPVSVQLLADNTQHAFNDFLEIVIEFGIIGLIMMVIAIVLILRMLTRKSNNGNVLYYGACFSVVGILVSALFSYPLHSLSVLVICVFYLAIASIYSERYIRVFIPSILARTTTIIAIGVCVYFTVGELKRMYALQKWENGVYLLKLDNVTEANPIYTEIYPALINNGKFLFDYGILLAVQGERKSIPILERAKLFYSYTDLYLDLGNTYSFFKYPFKAQEYYELAASVCPAKFIPRWYLLNFYIKTGQQNKAKLLAKSIISYPEKIRSLETVTIKDHSNRFLMNPKLFNKKFK